MMNCNYLNNIKDFRGSVSKEDNYLLLCDKRRNIKSSQSEHRHRTPTCLEIYCLCNDQFITHPIKQQRCKSNKCSRLKSKEKVRKPKLPDSVHKLQTYNYTGCLRSAPCFSDKPRTENQLFDNDVEYLIQQPFEIPVSRLQKNNFDSSSSRSENLMYEDTDFVPVKLKQTKLNDKVSADEKKIKMSNVRQNKSPERKVSSWGRILKEQNLGKSEQKRTLPSSNNAGRTKFQQPQSRYPQHPQEKSIPPQQSVTQQQKNKQKQVQLPPPQAPVKEIYTVPLKTTKKFSNHTLTSEDKRSLTSINSETTSVSGESIMLVDRSCQCSSTNIMDNMDNVYNVGEINQAGDNGLAFFNPVRTLNFLVRELRGKVSEGPEDENMTRIIQDLENTVTRLSKKSPQGIKENLSALISEDDLKFVLEILQNSPKMNKVIEVDKGTTELQTKLEETCTKLEDMCRVMEKTANNKLKEEKQSLISELNEKRGKLETAEARIKEFEQIVTDLKEKNTENSKTIMKMRDIQVKYTTLTSVLKEQVQDAKKENERLHNEMTFLFLEKEKNIILMKTKDEELVRMRESLEELKNLIGEQLNSYQLAIENKEDLMTPENDRTIRQPEFDRLTTVSAISTVTWHNANIRGIRGNNAPMCSSPATSTSPALEDDESWRRISKVGHEVQPVDSKAAGIKESLKNLFEEMKRQSKLSNNVSIQNLINLDEPMVNWSDQSDDEFNSVRLQSPSDSETNFSSK